MNLKVLKGKSAQIWVETAIYTLIGLAIIGIVLALATPAINRNKDKLILEQTMSVMTEMNNKIKDVRDAGAGNKRLIDELSIKKGVMEINGVNNEIMYVLEGTKLEYSEPGKTVEQGSINVVTESMGSKEYNVTLTLSYLSLDLEYLNNDDRKILGAASVPYKLSLLNNGTIEDPADPSIKKIWILIEEIS